MSRQYTDTIIGSIFTLVVINPHELAGIFITGMIGAIGAFAGSLIMKGIQLWVQKYIKQYRENKKK